MKDLHNDIFTGAVMITGLLGFVSGEFIISSTLFAAAAISSNIHLARKSKSDSLSC